MVKTCSVRGGRVPTKKIKKPSANTKTSRKPSSKAKRPPKPSRSKPSRSKPSRSKPSRSGRSGTPTGSPPPAVALELLTLPPPGAEPPRWAKLNRKEGHRKSVPRAEGRMHSTTKTQKSAGKGVSQKRKTTSQRQSCLGSRSKPSVKRWNTVRPS